jgi:hypothetical protein
MSKIDKNTPVSLEELIVSSHHTNANEPNSKFLVDAHRPPEVKVSSAAGEALLPKRTPTHSSFSRD